MALKFYPLADVSMSSAGSAVQISTTIAGQPSIIVQAPSGNTGSIYIGDSTVTPTKGIELIASASLSLDGSFLKHSSDEVFLLDLYACQSAGSVNKLKVAYLGRK